VERPEGAVEELRVAFKEVVDGRESDDWRAGGGEVRWSLALAKLLRTLASPPERVESGEGGASPGDGDMSSSGLSQA
jgi:hypothetical protein